MFYGVLYKASVIAADIEVACYGYEGVDAVKEALKCGLNMSTEEMPIKVLCNRHALVYTVSVVLYALYVDVMLHLFCYFRCMLLDL